jgi:soluble lytic murein transglycosylase-like protein
MSMSPAVQAQITAAAQAAGIDPYLAIAVANQESGGNQGAVSSSGAIGIFQLMPATAAGLGVDPTTTSGNIQGGVTYLAQLMDQYGGDTTLALAAYNAGPGNVAKYGGVPPFAETQNYVSSIQSALGLSPSADTSGSGDDSGSTSDSDVAGIDLSDPTTVGVLGLGALVVLWLIFR